MINSKIDALLIVLLLAISSDLRFRKISNLLILMGLVFSFFLQMKFFGGHGILVWTLGVSVAFLFFIPMYMLKAMAAGDVKLMMVVGGFLGYPQINQAIILTYVFGGVLAILYVVAQERVFQLISNLKIMIVNLTLKSYGDTNLDVNHGVSQSVGKIPFALAIGLGAVFTLLS